MDSQVSSVVFFVAFSTAILLILIALVVNLLLVGRNRRLKHQNHVLEMKSNFEKELMKTQVEVAENTLNDIALDLHDDIGQMLTLSKNHINVILKDIKTYNSTDLEAEFFKLRDWTQKTMESIRGISKTLSNDYLTSFGIHESLKRLFERLERQHINPKLSFPISVTFKSGSNELFVFRIIQELVNNTIKHAEASEISLNLYAENNTLKIEYRDNGKGISKELFEAGQLATGLGLLNINKRINLMNGIVIIHSDVGEGFYLQLTIPNE